MRGWDWTLLCDRYNTAFPAALRRCQPLPENGVIEAPLCCQNVSDQDLTSGTSWELARSSKWRFWGGWVWVMLGSAGVVGLPL